MVTFQEEVLKAESGKLNRIPGRRSLPIKRCCTIKDKRIKISQRKAFPKLKREVTATTKAAGNQERGLENNRDNITRDWTLYWRD